MWKSARLRVSVTQTSLPAKYWMWNRTCMVNSSLHDLLKSLELCTLNGRGKDNYTYISRLGCLACSVVDYCVVELEEFNQFSHFSVTSMQEVIRELQDSSQVSDNFEIHNCLLQPCVSFLYAKHHHE